MSLLAGFDFIVEISNAALLKQIQSRLKIQGTAIVPPFEITMPIAQGGVSGSAHLIVDKVLLDLNADDTLTLTFQFSNTSVIATAPLSATIAALDGSLTVKAGVTLVPSGVSNQRDLAMDLGKASVVLTFSAAAQAKIANALTNIPLVTPAAFISLASQAVATFIQKMGTQTVPLGLSVVSGKDGSLVPALQFEALEVHCIENAVRSKQALALFGTLLIAHHGQGNHTQKTSTVIPANHDVAISISPSAFHSLIFCPALAQSLLPTDYKTDPKAAVAKLPTTCGSGNGVDKDGVTITDIHETFANGHLDVDGKCTKSGFCYEADGSFHGEITLSMSGSTLTPTLAMDEPDVDVDIPWYCWLAAAGILLAIGGVIASIVGVVVVGIVNIIASVIANSLAKEAVGGISVPGATVGGLSGITLDMVKVTTEGLTLAGTMPITLPTPASKSLVLKGSVVTTSSQVLSTGTFHNTFCAVGDYPYSEYGQQQAGSYTAVAALLGEPLTLEWQVSAASIGSFGIATSESAKVKLVGNNGTITIPQVTTQYPFPLPDGSFITQDVHIGYMISGDTLKLTNTPAEGNYYLNVYVRATDPLGNTLQADAQGLFEGDDVEIGGGYYDKQQDCLKKLKRKLDVLTFDANLEILPPWAPRDYPPIEELGNLISRVMALGLPEAEEFVAHARLVHGSSFYRTLKQGTKR